MTVKIYTPHKLCTKLCSVLHSCYMPSLCSSLFMLTFSSLAFYETISLLPTVVPLLQSHRYTDQMAKHVEKPLSQMSLHHMALLSFGIWLWFEQTYESALFIWSFILERNKVDVHFICNQYLDLQICHPISGWLLASLSWITLAYERVSVTVIWVAKVL